MSRRPPAASDRRGRRAAALLGLAVVVAVSAGSLPAAAPATGAPALARLIVRTGGAVPSASTLERGTGTRIRAVRRLGAHLAVVTAEGDAARIARRLAALPSIRTAAPDRRLALAGARSPVQPGDRRYAAQWDLWDSASVARAGGYGVDAPRAWTRTTGSPDVVVAVLDTGNTAHPDLAGAATAPGYDFVSGAEDTGTADGDGWDADPADPGDACADTGEGDSWHGTFVAGEIVGQHRRTGSLAGAAPGVTLEPVRVLGACGGTEADAIAAIEWASGGAVPGVPVNARPASVISMSLGGGGGACSAALQTAVDDAVGRGAVVVAAAGNDGAAVASTSPANCRGVISVAATTRRGALAGYSNLGTAALSPTLAAPGGSGSDPVLGDGWDAHGRPVVVAAIGTSMAAPRVAAAAALVRSRQPGLSPDAVRRRLITTATRFPAAGGCTRIVCGAGIVDIGNAVGAPARFVHAAKASVTGRMSIGLRLTASPGRWRPAATTLRYRWLRDGEPMAGATGRTYLLRPRDAGHRIAVQVQARRAATATATAVSPARRAPVE